MRTMTTSLGTTFHFDGFEDDYLVNSDRTPSMSDIIELSNFVLEQRSADTPPRQAPGGPPFPDCRCEMCSGMRGRELMRDLVEHQGEVKG
jgi:hypothetical protein